MTAKNTYLLNSETVNLNHYARFCPHTVTGRIIDRYSQRSNTGGVAYLYDFLPNQDTE